MKTYRFLFEVQGDDIAQDWSMTKTATADSLEEAVVKTWEGYKLSISRILRTPVEAMVTFDSNVSNLFTLTGICDGVPLDESIIRKAFFQERLKLFKSQSPNWNTVYSDESTSS